MGNQNDDTFYVNLSIPLGGSQRVSTICVNKGKIQLRRAELWRLSQNMNYYISADRDNKGSENSVNGSLNSNCITRN
jgi:outer membrane usher protein FimD/PapC